MTLTVAVAMVGSVCPVCLLGIGSSWSVWAQRAVSGCLGWEASLLQPMRCFPGLRCLAGHRWQASEVRQPPYA
eukprot:scaffold195654_cov14-Prasinocladus_malaysianus.AAC.1